MNFEKIIQNIKKLIWEYCKRAQIYMNKKSFSLERIEICNHQMIIAMWCLYTITERYS